jgi:hypothetical protein
MKPRRAPRILVTDPRVAVVEGSDAADPVAFHAALELLVRWAIRAQERSTPDAPTGDECAPYAPEK